MKNPTLFFLGYREISTDADHAETLLNLCLWNEVSFQKIRREEDGSIRLFVTGRTAKRLCEAAERTGVPIKILHSGGLPVILGKRKLRFGLLAGSLCAALLIFLSGRFVWDVRVSGNEQIPTGEILEELSENGLYVGAYLPDFPTNEVENRVLLFSDRLSWISICFEGTVAKVQVREVTEGEKKTSTKPVNLVAKTQGQIESVELYRGNCLVKPGQAVKKGEMLVSGIYDSDAVGYRYTGAAGKVMARTTREFEIAVPLVQTEKVYEKRKIETVQLQFFAFSAKIFEKGRKDAIACDIIKEVDEADGFGDFCLPVRITKTYAVPYREKTVKISEEEALNTAYEKLENALKDLSPNVTLLQKEIRTEWDEETLKLRCKLTCIENIAEESEFEWVDFP